MLLHLPDDHTAETVRAAMTAKIKTLPEHLVRSITWDQGTEMAQHAAVHHRHRHPHLLLRPPLALAARLQREHQRPPAPMDAQRHRPLGPHRSRPRRLAYKLNNRPRQTLGWMKPSQALAELVAPTA